MSSVYSSTHVTRAKETETIKTSSPSICRLDSLFNTIGKKKKYIKEVEELEEEGKHAIDGSLCKPVVETLPTNEFLIEESEERRTLETSELKNKQFQNLLELLKNWINDELSSQRIIVKNLEDDLYDGQILGKLVEKLSGQQLDVIEITQNEDLQKYKLRVVLETSNRLLGLSTRHNNARWSVDGIHNKNLVELTHLLVALIRHYRAPIRLPENVFVNVVVVQRRGGQVISRTVSEQLTGTYDELGLAYQPRDAIDSLFTHAPERLQMVKKSLINFVNRHLNRINIECYTGNTGIDLDPNQFSDGLLLCFLMGMLDGYFVPLGNLFTTSTEPELDLQTPKRKKETALQPENYINTSPLHKLHNVNVAFQLMEDAGIEVHQRVRAEDIVNADLKSLIRVLYMIFTKYKHL